MITYPIGFWSSAGGPIKEDFEGYDEENLISFGQPWQYTEHQWICPKIQSRYSSIIWKDYGISGAYEDFSSYNSSTINTSDLIGSGNFDTVNFDGLSVGFYRDRQKFRELLSSDILQKYRNIDFNFGLLPPIESYESKNWGMRFVGKLSLKRSGEYKIYVEREGWSNIYVGTSGNGLTNIFSGWNSQPSGNIEKCLSFNSNSGRIDFLLNYYDAGGNASLRLYWEGPGFQFKQILATDFENFETSQYNFEPWLNYDIIPYLSNMVPRANSLAYFEL